MTSLNGGPLHLVARSATATYSANDEEVKRDDEPVNLPQAARDVARVCTVFLMLA